MSSPRTGSEKNVLVPTVEGRDTLEFDMARECMNDTVFLDDDKVVGRSMNCNRSVVLEEGEQGAQSAPVIDAPLLAEKDLNVSETAGSVSLPVKCVKRKRATVGAQELASFVGRYGKHFAAYYKGGERAVQRKIPAAVWKAI
ncbi:hypothetical protein BWQ96_06598 [Gracilariopsis chorda]|uniref:Uncharacterized protein n=1 Tax=Gracilariopsis chorda TaxID=448386 RepID=A0A2V3INL0_9FLOR|nr:hypothetical protein BWQ96_06598 [Gracilariopsis chorda]|eukprot:PXF43639.1 hypothetical protein BWQ96_06598 [Gracilariopsis chorda]